jgi:hypothetical protein
VPIRKRARREISVFCYKNYVRYKGKELTTSQIESIINKKTDDDMRAKLRIIKGGKANN